MHTQLTQSVHQAYIHTCMRMTAAATNQQADQQQQPLRGCTIRTVLDHDRQRLVDCHENGKLPIAI